MKKTLITIALTTVAVLALIGLAAMLSVRSSSQFRAINNNLGGGYDDYAFAEPAFAPAEAPMAMESFVMDSGGGFNVAYEESAVSANAAVTERLVIQNVDMSIVVADPKTRMSEIGDMAVEMGGFVVSSNLYQSTYGPNQIEVPAGNMTVRVPSEQLEKALENIKEGAVDITYENRSGQDVTNQYVDLQSRLSAKQEAERKLLEIMDDAIDSEDVLAIYMQVQNIQTEIEVLKGQMKYYEESAHLSAVSINLVAEETVKPIEIGGWKLQGTANESVQDLVLFTQGFVQFLIRFFLNYLWRILMVIIPLYGAFIGGRALFRRFRKSKPKTEVEEEK